MLHGSRVVMPRPYEVTVETFEAPRPGPGQLLVETEASAISPGTGRIGREGPPWM